MNNINIEFQEQYKRLDKILQDLFNCRESGVTMYISVMDNTPIQDTYYCKTWKEDYKQLKHLRWVRNQLAHEVGTFNSDICKIEDISWIIRFYNSVLNISDPLAIVRKCKEFYARKNRQMKVNNVVETPKTVVQKPQVELSFWQKFKIKIKNWFK